MNTSNDTKSDTSLAEIDAAIAKVRALVLAHMQHWVGEGRALADANIDVSDYTGVRSHTSPCSREVRIAISDADRCFAELGAGIAAPILRLSSGDGDLHALVVLDDEARAVRLLVHGWSDPATLTPFEPTSAAAAAVQ